MDRATLLGVVSGIALLAISLTMGGSLRAFWDVPSVMITIGGTIAATLIAYPLPKLVRVLGVLKNAFIGGGMDPEETIALMVSLSERARREGLLALEEKAAEIGDPFLRRGLQLVIDGTPAEAVREILESDIYYSEQRHKQGQGIFESMGNSAPAFGMLGTIIGLIQMLRSLDKPETIGPSLAVALVTTFYGSVLANLVFIPVAAKLRVKSGEEVLFKQLLLEGILAIQAGDNPRLVEEKMKCFLMPSSRDRYRFRKARLEAETVAERTGGSIQG
ncbi:MAG TPA: motility protein A [Firmicutes bacterium]|nr:motility protein A [Bacillota bacterium]